VVEMRVRDDDGANPQLLFVAQADGERAGVDRERVVDQVAGQQLMPAVARTGNDSEAHGV
jgi:hypothetical protein